jgi:glycosyltransferase involved in cell wall biosynthesis
MAMRVAIITPYWQEPRAVLERCIDSVAAQSVPALSVLVDHLLIADGAPQDWLDAAAARHIRLDRNHADYGNVARGLGALLAAGERYDAIAFLDADNRIDADHVALCLAAAQDAADDPPDVVIARRRFELPDGTPVNAAEDPGLIDTNCLFLLPGGFPVIARWALIPHPLAGIGDRVFHAALVSAGSRMVVTDRPSVTYLSQWAVHYAAAGRPLPADARSIDLGAIADWLSSQTPTERSMIDHLIGARVQVR